MLDWIQHRLQAINIEFERLSGCGKLSMLPAVCEKPVISAVAINKGRDDAT